MSAPKNTHTVVIDVGHGLNTYPPAKGILDFAEFSFNNAVGKMAKELAERNGFTVLLTQPFDSNNVTINDRNALIRVKGADMGASIHANATVHPEVTGHEFWYWYNNPKGKQLAGIMDANAIALLPNNRRGLKESSTAKGVNFGILRENYKIPFALAEFGFFTNAQERNEHLKDPDFQFRCAKVLVKSFCDYVGKEFTVNHVYEPIKAPPQWKVEGLQNLHKMGLITDYAEWVDKLDEPAPNWMVFTLLDRLYTELLNNR